MADINNCPYCGNYVKPQKFNEYGLPVSAEDDLNDVIPDESEDVLAEHAHLELAEELIAKQANDAGLWFIAETAAEAYLQKALRKLHAVIEGEDDNPDWEGA